VKFRRKYSSMLKKAVSVGMVAALLVSQQGFLFYEGLAQTIVPPKEVLPVQVSLPVIPRMETPISLFPVVKIPTSPNSPVGKFGLVFQLSQLSQTVQRVPPAQVSPVVFSDFFDRGDGSLPSLPSLSVDFPSGTFSKREPGKYNLLKELRQFLGDGTKSRRGMIRPFVFHGPSENWVKARSAGLEGFFYSKLEYEREWGQEASVHQLEDYFRYLEALLSPLPWTGEFKRDLDKIHESDVDSVQKNKRLNEFLIQTVRRLQARVEKMNQAGWGRNTNTYMILSRAYNRLKSGRNFFDSLDKQELNRIREEVSADEIWLMDIFQIGKVRRWGTGGGSPYSIVGYQIKEELGGEKAFKRFVNRAHRLGLKVKVDFIPNHTSLDNQMLKEYPEAFLHIVPPQHLTDEEIMAAVPKEPHGNHAPIYFLLETDRYPDNGSRVHKRILVHHPRTDFGDVMWVDLAQIDYSRPQARQWQIAQVQRLVQEFGVDSVRRDMAYEILNARYYDRWLKILSDEMNSSRGWMREEMARFISEFQQRWKVLEGEEFMENLTDAMKQAKPEAVAIDEAYSYSTDLSRAGSDGIYNKNDHDGSMGQVGLYDAMLSRDSRRIRAALRNVAFRVWQRGGAALVNFVGTHDGGEGNPIDKFGLLFKAAAVTALLFRPTLVYNGLEQGVGQREGLLGDLSKSQDTAKSIPFDIPVKINWENVHPENQNFLRMLFKKAGQHRDLFREGTVEVLEPMGDTPLVAWTVSRKDARMGGQKSLWVAANFSEQKAWGRFRMDRPVLEAFGGFRPRTDRNYILKDRADLSAEGEPKTYVRTGAELLKEGITFGLGPGGVHLFEVEEVQENRNVHWDLWTRRLTHAAMIPFAVLQIPQIMKNLAHLSAGHAEAISILPWMGYSTGLLGNMLLLSYFVSQKERGAATVQTVGVITTLIVLSQIFLAGFMPGAAFGTILPVILLGLVLNYLNFKDRMHGLVWDIWKKASATIALAALPQVLWATFASFSSYWPAVLGMGTGLLLLELDRRGRISDRVQNFWIKLSAWTVTLLFMFGPVAQLVNN
ncbi:MAG: hypothetical protein HY400_07215, partial [Elusimicrobia bacterium]|nr:hypothetical protein [Elusimicrobiota bacterium]